MPLSQHDILSQDECDRSRDLVLSLQKYWTARGSADFYTFGAASYMDAAKHYDLYAEKAKSTNELLSEHFSWLLERVRTFFSDLLDEPVFFDLSYALPGFHIFILRGEDQSGADVASRAHFDLQWTLAVPRVVPAGTISFTLPIEQPSGGASLEIWHTSYAAVSQLQQTASEYARSHASQTIEYACGRIVVHDGLILHAIGHARTRNPSGRRITLQGHGIRSPKGWLIYW